MRSRHITFLLLTSILASAQKHPAGTGPALKSDLQSKVDAYVRPLVESRNFSGCILLARNGVAALNRCYGMANYELEKPNTASTRFHIASVSKSLTAAAILLLEQQGKLKVEDKLAKFIPDYPRSEEITLHHLLTHTSGIPNVNNFPDYNQKSREHLNLEQVIALFKQKPLKFAPGSKYEYSNSNYNLLAYVIEKISGQSYGEFLRQNFFARLGMSESGNDDDPERLLPERASGYAPVGYDGLGNAAWLDWSIKTGNGSLYSTASDLLKWDQALNGEKVLKSETVGKMFRTYSTPFSYGWFVRERFGHRVQAINGRSPGFTASLERYPDDRATVILTANTYSALTQTMAEGLAAILLGQPYKPILPAKPVSVSPGELRAVAGNYKFGDDFFNPGLAVTLREVNGKLAMQSQDSENFLIPISADTFVDRLYGGTVSFVHDPSGKISAMKWNFGQDYV